MRVKTEAKRRAILEAAKGVFLARGYHAASMAEVAARVGGSKQTLYSYFPSKEQLFLTAMLERGAALFEPLLTALRDSPDLPAALEAYAIAFLRLICADEFLACVRIIHAEGAKSDLGAEFYLHGPKPCRDSIAERLRRAMAEGRMRQADPWRAALHLEGLCESGPYQRLLEGSLAAVSDQDLVQAAQAAVEVFVRGYEIR